MLQVNITDTKNNLSNLVAVAEQGDEVMIARDGVPIARIVKYEAPKIRPPGAWKTQVAYSDDWDTESTNKQAQQLFLGSDNATAT